MFKEEVVTILNMGLITAMRLTFRSFVGFMLTFKFRSCKRYVLIH